MKRKQKEQDRKARNRKRLRRQNAIPVIIAGKTYDASSVVIRIGDTTLSWKGPTGDCK